jgi:hypothetical protein
MKISRTLQLAVGSAVIVLIVVTYYFHGPLWPALAGALGAILWIASKAWRERLRSSSCTRQETKKYDATDSD